MEMIINPMWFYWLRVLDNLNGACVVLMIIFIIFAVTTLFVGISMKVDSYSENDSDYKAGSKLIKIGTICLIIAIITGLGYIFIPDRTTMIEMQVAKNVTIENLEWTKESLKETVDYIIEKIGEING